MATKHTINDIRRGLQNIFPPVVSLSSRCGYSGKIVRRCHTSGRKLCLEFGKPAGKKPTARTLMRQLTSNLEKADREIVVN